MEDLAVQVIRFDAATQKWIVNDVVDTLLTMFDSKARVRTVSTGGPAREGKSFLNNELAHDGAIGAVPQRFVVGHRGDPETHGVWAYARQFTADGPVTVFFDLEGSGDVRNGADYDAQLMALVTLLSSVLIYNVRGTLHAEHLKVLHGITRLVDVVTKGEAVKPDVRGFRMDECRGPMPHLWFLVQDAQLIQEGSADTWLQEQLNPLPGEQRDLGMIKRELMKQFVQRRIFRLPSPVSLMTPHASQALPQTDASGLEPEYVQGLTEFKRTLLSDSPNLQLLANGQLADLPVAAFASLVRAVVNVVNDGRGSHLCDGWPSPVLAPVLNDVVQKANASCGAKERELTASLPMGDAKLQEALNEVRNAGARVFAAERTLLLGATPAQLKEEVTRCVAPYLASLQTANTSAALELCNEVGDNILREARASKATYFTPQGLVEFQRQGDAYAARFKSSLFSADSAEPELRVPATVYDSVYSRVYQELTSIAEEISAEVNRQNTAERERVARELEEERKREETARNSAQACDGVRRADAEVLLARRTMMELAESQRITAEKALAESDAKLVALQNQLTIAREQHNRDSEKLMTTLKEKMEANNNALQKQLEQARRDREAEDAKFQAMSKANQDQLLALQHSINSRPPPSCCCVAASSLVEVKGKGLLHAGDVKVGDHVRTWDVRTSKTTWSEAYFTSVSADVQPLVRVSWGAAVGVSDWLDLTYDHLLMIIKATDCQTGTGAVLPTAAGEVTAGDQVLLLDGTVSIVREVKVAPSEDRVAALLLLSGSFFANGVWCSSYDSNHVLGIVENCDLRLFYHITPLAVSGSNVVRRYADWCDRHLHAPLRWWLGFKSRNEQVSTLLTAAGAV
jgi:hypothetical protein